LLCTGSATQKLIGTSRRENGLYILDELKVPVAAAAAATTTVDLSSFRLSLSSSSFYLWHSRLGHVSSSRLRFLASTRALGNLKTCDISDCSGCKLAKFSALPFNQSISVSSSPFDLIRFILMYGDLLLMPQNKGFDIMSLLLMIILVIVGFI